jgi:dTDP-4-amino-4,6-dideoxygalactose transaminase
MSGVVESPHVPEKVVAGSAATVAPWRVPLSDVTSDPELEAALVETIRSGWWSSGPRVSEFEAAFARMCGSREAIAVANGTAALHLALLALECGPGDEVIVPSLNFVAGANMIGRIGATPVFCDIGGDDDLTVDPAAIEAAVTPNTKAIMVMHYGGHPCRMEAILEIASKRGIAVIEDAAHAPGAMLAGRACGTFGAVGCFSFFSNKNLPIGEGGMVVTDDEDLAGRLRLLRSHGMTTLTWDRHKGHAGSYDVLLQGLNYRMDDPHAAIGVVQLGRLAAWNAARARIASIYREHLHGFGGIHMPFPPRNDEMPAHHLAVILLPHGSSRSAFREQLASDRIQTSVHYPPTHMFAWYRSQPSRRRLSATESVADRLVTLPLYPAMDDASVSCVIEATQKALAERVCGDPRTDRAR